MGIQLKTATVTESPSPIIKTKYGDRQVLEITTDKNEIEKIWFNPDSEYNSLKLGQKIGLMIDNGKKKLIIDDSLAMTSTAITELKVKESYTNINTKSNFKTMSNDTKREIADYLQENINLYFFAYKEIEKKANNENIDLTQEDKRTIATTMYLSTQRKFNLT